MTLADLQRVTALYREHVGVGPVSLDGLEHALKVKWQALRLVPQEREAAAALAADRAFLMGLARSPSSARASKTSN